MEQYREETKAERRARIQAERRRVKHMVRIIAVIVLVLAVLVIALLILLVKSRLSTGSVGTTASDAFSFTYVGDATEIAEGDDESGTGAMNSPIALPIPELSGENLYSDYAYMVRLSDNAVVFDKAGTDKIYPASMAKMMTALVVIDSGEDLRTQVTVQQSDIDPGYLAGATLSGFVAGETVTIEELLYGVLLPSGADACLALATEIAGGEEEFVERMNAKAQEIGMTNTHFSNCTGLHDDNLYSTCSDIALLMKTALQKSTFRHIVTTATYTTGPTAQHPDGVRMKSTLFEVLVNNKLNNGVVIEGGKTGTTDEAENCLASYATAANESYILVTAHAAENAATSHPNISDAVTMYEQLPAVSG